MEPTDLDGRIIAHKYKVLSILGQGAMGVVYLARQIALEKTVALKVLSDELRGDPEFVTRFHTEARTASRLDHPNSTRVLDFGQEPDGLLYIAMELLEGRTLATALSEEPMDAERIASIMSQALSAVGAAHALNILHRDLKPENIVILEARDDEDRRIDVVKVCDFGIAKLDGVADPERRSTAADGRTELVKHATSIGAIIGTPQYMSPEQARAEKLDVRSDLYSLGVVLFELLTGRPPFDVETPAQMLHCHASVEPPRPSSIRPNVDPTLEAICLRALQKKPEDRFASAREMRLALRPLTKGAVAPRVTPRGPAAPRNFDASAPTLSEVPVTSSPVRRRRVVWLAPLIATAGVAVLALVAWRHFKAPNQPVTTKPTQTATPTAEPTAMIPTDHFDRVSSAAPSVATMSEVVHPMLGADRAKRLTNVVPTSSTAIEAHDAIMTPVALTLPSPPPPQPTSQITAPPPTVTTSSPPPPNVRADPSRAHVDVGSIQVERVNVVNVESAMRHVNLTSCYQSDVTAGGRAEGAATLVLDMDEASVTRAVLVGGSFSAPLRRCVTQRVSALRVPNVDTGDATARVTLQFSLQ